MRNLKILNVRKNFLENHCEIAELQKISNLKFLDVRQNDFKTDEDVNLYAVFYLKGLKTLNGFEVSNFDRLAAKERFEGLLNFEFLELKFSEGRNLNFKGSRSLDISNSKLKIIKKDFFTNENFPLLERLSLEGNFLTNVENLSFLENLKFLNLNKNSLKIHEMRLVDFPNLKVLLLDENLLADMERLNLVFVQNAPKLVSLSLKGNEFVALEGLRSASLAFLFLSKNKIRNLDEETQKSLTNLNEIFLDENQLRNLDQLRPMPRISLIDLSANRLGELNDIEGLSVLAQSLKRIKMAKNQICRKGMYRLTVIKTVPLINSIDDVLVTKDEFDRLDYVTKIQNYNLEFSEINKISFN